MKDSGRIGWTQRSKVLSIVTLMLIVTLLLGTVTFLSLNKKQAQGNTVATPPVSKTPTAVTSSGIYMVANSGSVTNSILLANLGACEHTEREKEAKERKNGQGTPGGFH